MAARSRNTHRAITPTLISMIVVAADPAPISSGEGPLIIANMSGAMTIMLTIWKNA